MNNKVSNKTKNRVLFRWILNGGASLNYEKMMGLAYTYSMLPFLKENYAGDPKGLKESVKTHLQFFNTNPYLAPYVLGMNIGIEEKEKSKSLKTIMGLKTGLMGPLAGLGDSVFVVIPWTIFGAIAANMALSGSPLGIFLWFIVTWLLRALGIPLFKAGMKSGTSLLTSIETKMKLITESVSILGLMVVGGLIPTVVKPNLALKFKQGSLTMTGNQILNQIMPGLLPAALVFGVYYLLGKKVKPIYIILIIIVLAIVLYVLGIMK
ncbi:PTS system mannose/fructose/sorbose family transporter subunit IID [Lactobacillus sp. ESL0731]|uniref:PTS system mannose/fructose/sorbose family transporter subunit IID n=1 Tax=unclassified Lactobacillus TaxID=2620435 RepID=UPI0023F87D6B|nr:MULTISPECIES: PTS system mannose/fructose/sorbose family transporter subunit IID [unclassified Lactobacillus]WEV50886.1 PTS system mannose/fructose/sorbose family transporter subunit IID [Lactobacillus sp. ESL0700]WEV62017.1 PTS system mannose/fructose/sorbose family transporter subunit IID [Lactobacillus sp. ESL0731]